MTTPLAGLRVLAVEQFGAGPWATLQLADLGAEVIKIEDPDSAGDVGRYVPPYQEGSDSLFFESFNRGKRSVSLDLRNDAGRAVFHDLVRASHAVFSNLRGDGPVKLGLTYEDLRGINPAIVCVSLSGFGMSGPRAAEAGYDYIIQAMAGWMSLTGDPDAPPTKSGLSLVDLSGGYVAAIALLAGIHRAQREGVGCDADVSLFETALSELMYVGTWAATNGYLAPRRANSAHPSIVPFQAFATSDGHITVAAAKPHFWERLCAAIERPDLLADPRYADFATRDANRETLLASLDAVFATQSTQTWIERLAAAGVPAGRVNDVAQALADKQTVARGAVVAYEHPTLGTVRQAASPLRLSGELPEPSRAPLLGEDTEGVLRELCGYDAERIAELDAAGALGTRS
ncbi:MAG TPA: CoA transferase [Solirubrobacteraceae bacterium]|jgi:crotonobetainyl-CoA:carnitine CoA-transferase CaiB-like acyl-CoA transferase|nr:CoA transferase [Solirubrobacteraceae bacterium]